MAYEGHVYGFDNATFKCLNAETGERCWAKRGLGKGSQLIAEDRLIVFSDQGTLVLVDTDPAAYRELGRVRIFEQAARTWTPPSLAGGHLYVRRATGELVRLDLRASSGVETAARSEETSATTPGVRCVVRSRRWGNSRSSDSSPGRARALGCARCATNQVPFHDVQQASALFDLSSASESVSFRVFFRES